METKENKSFVLTTQRRSFNPTGSIGSFYDARIDKIIQNKRVRLLTERDELTNVVQCTLMKNEREEPLNLMKALNIHYDLRLSVLLGMAPDNNLGRMIHDLPSIYQFTHMIYYTSITRMKYLPDKELDRLFTEKSRLVEAYGTYLIIGIQYGIDAAIMFNLRGEEGPERDKIDELLKRICDHMQCGDQLNLSDDDESLLDKIDQTRCWSNMADLNQCSSIHDFCRTIQIRTKTTESHPPFNYYIYPIKLLFSLTNLRQVHFNEISRFCVEKIEDHVLRYLRDLTNSSKKINEDLRELKRKELKRLSEWVYNGRGSQVDESNIDEVLSDGKSVKSSHQQITTLSQLLVPEEVHNNDEGMMFLEKPTPNQAHGSVLSTNADFSRSTPRLTEADDLASRNNVDSIINILLLGESGVGKSTFINSLVNYLRCKTFEDADRKDPIVLLPISFMVTTGSNFDERQVEYPGIDGGSEEMHDQPGQSVTQHCRSYLFTIKCDDQKERKVRLIDTPGVGDTRGIDQDEKNIAETIAYINHLKYLHAVCIVLKPNLTRLTIAFRWCLKKVLDLFGDDADQFIFFCFTNTRSTFYSPGNTGPILRHLLESFQRTRSIPFGRTNTFCFDSESFRYLVTKQAGIEFDSESSHECKDTWNRSAAESKRLLRTIINKNQCYRIRSQLASIDIEKTNVRMSQSSQVMVNFIATNGQSRFDRCEFEVTVTDLHCIL